MKGVLIGFLFVITALCFGQDKMPGHYWDKKGVKHEGKLKMVFHSMGIGTMIKFYEKGEKAKRLDQMMMESFVWDTDSFTLIDNFEVSNSQEYESDFAKVVSTGKINLYKHWRKKHSDGIAYSNIGYLSYTYLIRLEGTINYIGIYNKKQFENYLMPMIRDNKELYERILAMPKKAWMRNISKIIKEYNR